jgi:hypothetical protein
VPVGSCVARTRYSNEDCSMRIVKGCLDCRHEKVNGEGGLCLYVGFGTRAIMTNTGVDSWSSVLILRALISSSGFDIGALLRSCVPHSLISSFLVSRAGKTNECIVWEDIFDRRH